MPNRLTRLTTLLTQLQAGKLVTARQLADRHGVGLRTIYRDVRTLEEAGVPIINVEGKGYTLLDGYRMPPVMFTESEANAMITAEELISANKDTSLASAYHSAVTKIKAVLPGSAKERSDLLAGRLQSRDNPGGQVSSSWLMTVQDAIVNYRVCAIEYTSQGGSFSEREVEPFAVYTTAGNWIMIAYCRWRSGFRAFRLDRVKSCRLLSRHFTPHTITLEDYLAECRKKYIYTPDIGLSPGASNFTASTKQPTMTKQTLDSLSIMGISVRTSNADPGKTTADISGLWQRFLGENLAAKIPGKIDSTVFCVYTDYETDHTGGYTTILGCRVASLEDVPDGMVGVTIPGGAFQQFTCRGNLSQGVVYQAWLDIWKTDLNRTYVADYEMYGAAAMNPEDATVDIFVGVQ